MFVQAYVRSLSYGRQLLTPFFAAKRMTPMQVELFIAERQFTLRVFGFSCALVERIPLLGIVLSVSNRVGAAMLAHDLEKRQQLFRSGERKKLAKEETYNMSQISSWRDLVRPSSPTSSQRGKLPFAPQAEDDFVMPGAVQSEESRRAALRAGQEEEEALRRRRTAAAAQEQSSAPALPPRGGRSNAASSHPDDAPPAYTEEDALRALGAAQY